MNLFGMMEVSASALGAERVRAEVVTSNLANAESTRTPEGGPYQRREVIFAAPAPVISRCRWPRQARRCRMPAAPACGYAAWSTTPRLRW